jgi:hypothetical protein
MSGSAIEGGAGLLEIWRCAATLLARSAAGIETAQPLPLGLSVRVADAFDDGADMDITEIDLPAVGAVRVLASGEIGHGRSNRGRAGIGKAR